MRQRSPTSKGCMMKTKMIASKMVLQVFPNTKAARTSCDEKKISTFVVATPVKRSHTTNMMTMRTDETSLFNCLTAVFVSFRAWPRAFRLL